MKGAQGIMIAVAMGVVGFVCNWLYLEREASRVELVSFVGVSQPADVKRGDVIESDDLVPISMPKSHESQLAQVAVLWDQRDLVIGQKAARDLAVSGEAELVMHRDLTTPAIKDINELIADNERVMWLPVDSRTLTRSMWIRATRSVSASPNSVKARVAANRPKREERSSAPSGSWPWAIARAAATSARPPAWPRAPRT